MEEKTKKIYGIKKDIVLLYVALIVLGLVFMIFPQASAETICYIIAVSLIAWGAFRLRGYFHMSRFAVFGSYGLVDGSLLILAGVFILIRPAFLAGFIMGIVGFALVADGILKIQYAVDLLRIRGEIWWVLAVLALLMIGAGIVVILDPFHSAKVLMIFTGAFLVASGVVDLAAIIYISRKLKLLKQAMESGEFDAEFVEK